MLPLNRRIAATTAGLLMLTAIAIAQRPEFEVASVKLNKNNGKYDAAPQRSGDLILMHNTRLYAMIFYAFHLTARYQLVADQKPQQWWD
jgi:hypothetical protein